MFFYSSFQSEEEKICLARALVELKLEYSQLKESSEDSNYDLTKKLLEANGRISELEKRSESLRVDGTNIKDMNSRVSEFIKLSRCHCRSSYVW